MPLAIAQSAWNQYWTLQFTRLFYWQILYSWLNKLCKEMSIFFVLFSQFSLACIFHFHEITFDMKAFARLFNQFDISKHCQHVIIIFSVRLVIHYALSVGTNSTRQEKSAQRAVVHCQTTETFPQRRFWKSLTAAVLRETVKQLSLSMKKTAPTKPSNAGCLSTGAISKRQPKPWSKSMRTTNVKVFGFSDFFNK